MAYPIFRPSIRVPRQYERAFLLLHWRRVSRRIHPALSLCTVPMLLRSQQTRTEPLKRFSLTCDSTRRLASFPAVAFLFSSSTLPLSKASSRLSDARAPSFCSRSDCSELTAARNAARSVSVCSRRRVATDASAWNAPCWSDSRFTCHCRVPLSCVSETSYIVGAKNQYPVSCPGRGDFSRNDGAKIVDRGGWFANG